MKTTSKEYTLLSKKGMKELKKTISQLEHDRQAAITALRELDKTLGHDERLARIERLSILENVEAELFDKKQLLKRAKLMPSKRARLGVAIGSVVDLIDQQGRLVRYTIVDSVEANPSDGRISAESPLGSTLLGKQVAEVVEWTSGLKAQRFELVRVS